MAPRGAKVTAALRDAYICWSQIDLDRHMIEVVAARLNQGSEALRAMWELLTEAERRRALRLRFERDRRRFVVARARLRELLAERLGARP